MQLDLRRTNGPSSFIACWKMIAINTKVPAYSRWFTKCHEFGHALHAHMNPEHFIRLQRKDAKRECEWPLRFVEQSAHYLAVAIGHLLDKPLDLDKWDQWMLDVMPPPLKEDLDNLVIRPGFTDPAVLAELDRYEKFDFKSAPWVNERALMDLRLSSALGTRVRGISL